MAARYKLLVFNSTHHALQAEEILTSQTELMMVPVPPEINADCGLAVKLTDLSTEKITKLITEHDIEAAGLYQVEAGANDTRIKKLN